ncbi:sensor histidine kinase [Azohydromonas lata]|uniref:histidine kinase n=1 Tax=Azohydromonas lata TaxID=45677 RepID=A0ABU5I9G8_9BURK|nr:ATP-binding protein [Azohydromonas lata]MDZ5455295.1 ATP-binding protein [Azohydromonas lata]
MSHELRTPLNAVIGFSDVLAQTPLPGKAGEHVGHIQQAGRQLLALIEDVLDFAQIEDGEVQLQQAPFELGVLLQAACDETQPQAAAKGLALRLDLASDLPGQVIGDALRLKQVLVHLLSNAVKFTPAGSVTLAATASAHGDLRTTLRLEVKDSGIGIAPEVQSHIFNAFTQLDGTPTRRFGGAGLGLSIVQRLVTMMGGHLELTSTPGQGSTFSVSLLLETASGAH